MAGPGAAAIAARAGRNASIRAAADLVAKFASLAVVVLLARLEGAAALGTYVLALAWAEVLLKPVDMGYDRWMIRRLAEDHGRLQDLPATILRAKLLRLAPVLAVGAVLVALVGYDARTVASIAIVVAGWFVFSVGRTFTSVFTAFELGAPAASVLLVQRLASAALAVPALLLGAGVVGVAVAWSVGTAASVVLAVLLVRRHVGLPPLRARGGVREATRRSLPFAAQEVLAAGLGRVDALLLSALATTTAVGVYGAGYRLLEATLFLPLAVTAASSAMFTYLRPDSDPPVGAAYQRALKAVLGTLVPCALVLGLLSDWVLGLLFGDELQGAGAASLQLLAPVVVLLGVVLVSNSLSLSRGRSRGVVLVFAAALAVNVVACLLLIPPLGAEGAAAAMLVTYALFAVVALVLACRAVGTPSPAATAAAPLAGGVLMAAVLLALGDLPLLAAVAGVAAYAGGWVLADRRASPGDLAWVLQKLRLRRPAAA